MANTRAIAKWITELDYSDLPEAVREKAKEVSINSWGVQLAASTLPWSSVVYRYGRSQGGTPEATVLVHGHKTTVGNAAFINGAFAHGFEMDDNHGATGIKGGSATVPTALAMSERQLASGKAYITALVAGYEVMTRLGLAGYKTIHVKGHHPTGHLGAIGSAAIVSKLLNLDIDTTTHALGIATAHMIGLTSSSNSTSERGYLKRTYGGQAAFGGIRAALLAQEGLTSTETMLDVGSGFCRAFDVDAELEKVMMGSFGTNWEILNAHYKIYAQDGHIQPMSEAIERLRKEHVFDVEDIEWVRIGTNKVAFDEVVGPIKEPKDLTDAQYSAVWSAALYLMKGGAGFREYTDENLADPKILELSRRISLYIDDEQEAEFQRTHPRGAKVTIRLKSGEEFTQNVVNLRAMTREDMNQKFRSLASVVLDTPTTERLLDEARNLELVADMSSLLPLFVR